MRIWRWLFVIALIGAGLFVGLTALAQFENYQEAGGNYLTPFHDLNITMLVLVAMALFVFAVCIASDKFEESRAFLGNYIRVVLLTASGVILLGVGVYESEVNAGETWPFFQFRDAYHDGDILAVLAVAVTLLWLAVYYLFHGTDDDSPQQHAPVDNATSTDASDVPGPDDKRDIEIELVIRADYPDAELLNALASLLRTQQFSRPDPLFGGLGGGIFGQPLGGDLFDRRPGGYNIATLHGLVEYLEMLEHLRKPKGDKPSDDSPPPEPEAPPHP